MVLRRPPPPGVEIRPAREEEHDAIRQIFEVAWSQGHSGIFSPKEIELALSDPDAIKVDYDTGRGVIRQLVVIQQSRLAGGADIRLIGEGTWLVEPMHVHPDYQGRHLGSALWDFCAREAFSYGASELRVWVIQKNVRARSFYATRPGMTLSPLIGTVTVGTNAQPADCFTRTYID